MGRNLTSLYISSSFQGLTQISGSILTDGTGSNIDNLTITASNATSASYASTATSASYAATASYSENAANLDLQQVLINGNTATGSIELRGVVNEDKILKVISVDSLGGASEMATFSTNIAGGGDREIFRFIDSSTFGALLQMNPQRGIAKIDSQLTGLEIEASGDITLDPQYTNPLILGKVVILGPTTSSYGIQADGGFTGSLQGNADTATSASHALISDFAHSATSASFATTALLATTASHAVSADSASFAFTASYLDGGVALSAVLNEGNVATNDIILTGSYLRHSASFSGNVIDNLTTPTASEAINHIVYLSAAEYSALPTPDENTLYVISGSSVIAPDTLQEVLTAGNQATLPINLTGSIAPSSDEALVVQGGVNIGIPSLNTMTGQSGSGIFGGHNNSVSGNVNATLGGRNNTVSDNQGTNVAVGGEYHSVNGFRCGAFAGEGNTVNGTNVAALSGYGNTIGGTYSAFAGGNGNNIGGTSYFAGGLVDSQGSGYIYAMLGGARLNCQTDSTFLGGGEDNTSVSGHRKGAIIAGDNNTLNGSNTDRSVIIGGTTNTIQSGSQNSVILGGQNIVSDASDTVYVPNLNISGSLTDSDGNIGTAGQVLSSNGVDKVQWVAGGGGGSAFPYTGSADISGSLNVTGSITAVLNSFENIDIKYEAVASLETPNILIGYQEGAFDASGVNNILLGSSHNASLTNSNRFIGLTGTNYGNAILGGSNNYISGSSTRTHNTILGGNGNTIGKDDLPLNASSNLVGGSSNDIYCGSYNVVLGGLGHDLLSGSLDSLPSYNAVLGGSGHDINGGDYNGLLGGFQNDINDTRNCAIIGGELNAINQTINANLDVDSVIVGGRNNVITNHERSVILGGDGLTTSKDDEVVVPNLTISGSAVGGVYTLADAAGTTTMDCSLGNFFTLTMPAGGSTTLTPTNITAGQTINVKITQNATPSTIAFAAAVDFEGGTPFAVSTGAGEVDVMTFISFDGTTLQATGLKNFS